MKKIWLLRWLLGNNIMASVQMTGSTTTELTTQPVQHGHSFCKKTFHKPSYCHHCSDMLWGLIQQGFICEGMSHTNHYNFFNYFSQCHSPKLYIFKKKSVRHSSFSSFFVFSFRRFLEIGICTLLSYLYEINKKQTIKILITKKEHFIR